MTQHANRRERLRALMAREKLDYLLISHPANRYYLSGFELRDTQCNESSGCLIVARDGKDWLCTDSRYEEAALGLWDKERVFIYRGSAVEEVGDLLRGLPKGPVGFEAKILSWDYVGRLEPGLELRPADGLTEELRVIKDADEIALLERSVALNHEMMAAMPGILARSADEAEAAWLLERFFRERGASENSFPPIVARDRHAALPHYDPTERPARIEPGCHVLVDAGARLERYCSDQTRTFWVGDRPDERFLRTLDMVQNAQRAAIEGLRPGLTGADIHRLAVESFAAHGEAERFTHSLGHGVGLEVHEEPRLSPRSRTVLRPGMVVTVEPGLYYPDWGGVRWEYMVVVTEDGCRVL